MEEGDWEWFHNNIQDLVGTDDFPLPRADCCNCEDLVEENWTGHGAEISAIYVPTPDEWLKPTYTEFLKFILKDYPEMIPDGEVEHFMEGEIADALINLKEVCEKGEDGYGHDLRKNHVINFDGDDWKWRWTAYNCDSTLVGNMIKGTHLLTPPTPLPPSIADTIPMWGVDSAKTAWKQLMFEGTVIEINERIDYLWDHTKSTHWWRDSEKPIMVVGKDEDEDMKRAVWLSLYRNDKRKRKFSTSRSLAVDVRENKSSISVNTDWQLRTWEGEDVEDDREGMLRIADQTLHWRPLFTCPWFGKVVMVNRARNTIAATFYYYFSHLYNEKEMYDEMGKNLKRYIEYACNDSLGRGFGHDSETTEEELQDFLKKKQTPPHYSITWDEWLMKQYRQAQEQAFYEINAPTIVKMFVHEPEIVGYDSEWTEIPDARDKKMWGTTFYSLHPWSQLFLRREGTPFIQFRFFTQYETYIGMLNEQYTGAGFGMLNWEW